MSEAIAATDQGENSFFARKMTIRHKLTKGILWLAVLGGILGLATVALQAKGGGSTVVPSPPAKAKDLPVTTVEAKRSVSYARTRTYTGLLRESRRSQLSFQRSGELLELLVDDGEQIKMGQSLGRLDDRHIRARRTQVEAQVAEAKAVLDELIAGPRKESISAKRAELRAQQSQRKILASQLERRRRLVQSASVSQEEYETFLHDYDAAVAREDVIARQLDEMLAGTRVEKISAQRARLAQLDAQLTDIAHDLQDTQLIAPFAGRVSRRLVDEGNVVAAGTPVVEVIDDANVEAWIGLPPSTASKLVVWQSHALLVGDQSVNAIVQSLAPDVEQTTRTRKVIFRLNDDDSTTLPGQVVRLVITEQVPQPGYWVPTAALTRSTRGLWSVYVVDKGVIARRDVELLDSVGTDSFVRGTLQSGDEVVASGTHRVVLGQKVTVQRATVAQR